MLDRMNQVECRLALVAKDQWGLVIAEVPLPPSTSPTSVLAAAVQDFYLLASLATEAEETEREEHTAQHMGLSSDGTGWHDDSDDMDDDDEDPEPRQA